MSEGDLFQTLSDQLRTCGDDHLSDGDVLSRQFSFTQFDVGNNLQTLALPDFQDGIEAAPHNKHVVLLNARVSAHGQAMLATDPTYDV